jgi:hypothetical protein
MPPTGSPWRLIESKTPGRGDYYFNTTTNESVWKKQWNEAERGPRPTWDGPSIKQHAGSGLDGTVDRSGGRSRSEGPHARRGSAVGGGGGAGAAARAPPPPPHLTT